METCEEDQIFCGRKGIYSKRKASERKKGAVCPTGNTHSINQQICLFTVVVPVQPLVIDLKERGLFCLKKDASYSQ